MIKFIDNEHKEAVLETLKKCGKIDEKYVDSWWLPAVYILCCDQELRSKSLKYCIIEETGNAYIDFEIMIKEMDFSSGYYAMVKLAANLYNYANFKCSVDEFIYAVDTQLFEVGMTAITLRTYKVCKVKEVF